MDRQDNKQLEQKVKYEFNDVRKDISELNKKFDSIATKNDTNFRDIKKELDKINNSVPTRLNTQEFRINQLENEIKEKEKFIEMLQEQVVLNTTDRIKKNAQIAFIRWVLAFVGLSNIIGIVLLLNELTA